MPEKCIKDCVAAAKASVAHQPQNQINPIKMKSMILVALAFVAVAVALPVEPEVTNVRSGYDLDPEGGYRFGYENTDGSNRDEVGELKETVDADNKPVKVIVVRGSYTFTDPLGVSNTITYVADEGGFRAEGPSIPQVAARR